MAAAAGGAAVGDSFLNAATLLDDRVRDVFYGNSRHNWFLAAPQDVVVGRISTTHRRRCPATSDDLILPSKLLGSPTSV